MVWCQVTDLRQPPRLWVSDDGDVMIDLEMVTAAMNTKDGTSVWLANDPDGFELTEEDGESIMRAFKDYRGPRAVSERL